MMRYYVEINKHNASYSGKLYRDNPLAVRELPRLALGEKQVIKVNGKSLKLGELIQRLTAYQPGDLQTIFNERGQLEIGQYLFKTIFNSRNDAEQNGRSGKRVEIRIVTNDEHIARLPWVLLADEGIFLSTSGWSVALSSRLHPDNCELPTSPNILAIMPKPIAPETGADIHLED